MQIGRRIYYDASTGNLILDTGEREGAVIPTTIEQDYESYKALKDRVPSLVGVIELEFGEYAQDFAESNGVRVNVETERLEFSYPDPGNPETPVFQKPFSEQLAERDKTIALQDKEIKALYSHNAFLQGDVNFIYEALITKNIIE